MSIDVSTLSTSDVGRAVRFDAAAGDAVGFGTITSWNEQSVFVRFSEQKRMVNGVWFSATPSDADMPTDPNELDFV